MSINILFVGDHEWPEFRDVHSWLRGHSELRSVPNGSAATAALARNDFCPALIVFAQRWPDEFSETEIDRLRSLAPLVRIIEILGSWCQRRRSDDVPAATLPLYWHQAIARLGPEFDRAARGSLPTWGLPATASDEERLLAVSCSDPLAPQAARHGLLAIRCRSVDAGALCQAAASRGFSAVWIKSRLDERVSGVTAAIFDCRGDGPREIDELAAWRAALGEAPIAALVSFPRVEQCERLLEAGATYVVSKPFWLGDLFDRLTTALKLPAS